MASYTEIFAVKPYVKEKRYQVCADGPTMSLFLRRPLGIAVRNVPISLNLRMYSAWQSDFEDSDRALPFGEMFIGLVII